MTDRDRTYTRPSYDGTTRHTTVPVHPDDTVTITADTLHQMLTDLGWTRTDQPTEPTPDICPICHLARPTIDTCNCE